MENDQFNGAGCAKMILNLERVNSLTQSEIQNYAVSHNYSSNMGQPYIDPYGMYRVLNNYGSTGYNFGQVTRLQKEDAYNDLCYWISNTIPNVNNPNMPSAVPTGGNYNNWMIVNGFRSSANPHSSGNYTVYGFYLKDPDANGIGQDIYIQAEAFGTSYFKRITSSDIWNSYYVTVDEPPVNNASVTIESLWSTFIKPVSDQLRFQAVEKGLINSRLMCNDENIIRAMDGASRGRTYFVNLPGISNDYYIVTFEKDGGCTLAAIIDANNGALKEVSFNGFADKNYYDNLKSGRTSMKSTEGDTEYHNSFYPPVDIISAMIDTDPDDQVITDFDFTLVPNPAMDHITLVVNQPVQGLFYAEIYSITGELIRKIELYGCTKNNYYPISLQGLENGMYIVGLVQNGEKMFKKLIVGK
jgi:hypothetical protein